MTVPVALKYYVCTEFQSVDDDADPETPDVLECFGFAWVEPPMAIPAFRLEQGIETSTLMIVIWLCVAAWFPVQEAARDAT